MRVYQITKENPIQSFDGAVFGVSLVIIPPCLKSIPPKQREKKAGWAWPAGEKDEKKSVGSRKKVMRGDGIREWP